MDGRLSGYTRPVVQSRSMRAAPEPHTEVLVAGLRWDTARHGASADLDLSCALLGSDLSMVDTVTPRRARNANASVVHTGDSTNGAGAWDDERVFIFLDEVPASVRAIMLVVASATGELIARIPNASCHVSDHETEEIFLKATLTRVVDRPVHCVASVVRGDAGWRVLPGYPDTARAAGILHGLHMAAFNKTRVPTA